MLSKEALRDIYEKYLRNECSEEELQALVSEMGAASPGFQEEQVFQLLEATWQETGTAPDKYRVPDIALTAEKPRSRVIRMARGRFRIMWWAAACFILLSATATYIWLNRNAEPAPTQQRAQQDLPPGRNRAVLTLANGTTVALDSNANAVVAQQGNTKVLQQENGTLVYDANSVKNGALLYNTLATPRGGQYQLVLPDGSKVWLNASSFIKFPTAFTGAKREVFIGGEVYFEVQKDARRPFVVSAGGSKIEVLGTHFDVKAYADESSVNATLVEGSIRFSGGGTQKVLKPDQQVRWDPQSGEINIREVDAQNAVAWVQGKLALNGAGLAELMQQISRWYDVDVEIKGRVPGRKFQGILNRNVSLSYVLEALNANGIHARLEGKKIVVSGK